MFFSFSVKLVAENRADKSYPVKLCYTNSMQFKPVILVVLDGFGINTLPGESPLQKAKKPTFDEFTAWYPFTTLQASGIAAGLPWGEEGNSEVGHLTMGSGRVLYHHLPRIIVSIQDGTFFENTAFRDACANIRTTKGTFHIMGLFSSGSVHAYADHLYALLELVKREEIPDVALHLFGDGRDAPAQEMKKFIPQLEERMRAGNRGVYIASLIGRHFSMDREERWNFTEEAYDCLTGKKGAHFENPRKYIDDSYAAGVTDEFFAPAWLADEKGNPRGRIKEGDSVIFFNFREDSVRQLAHAFLDEDFSKFERAKIPNLFFVTMTEYEKGLAAHVAFPPLDIEWPLARVVSYANKKQLHVAETEKYAHVTYFFNGGKEQPFSGEDRKLVPSARVPFDQKPEMSAREITEATLSEMEKYDLVLINFANPDMVGHTGNFEAVVKAIEVIDECLAKIKEGVTKLGGVLVVTADHGNAEEKRYRLTGEKRTKHSSNPIPFFLIAQQFKRPHARTPQEIEENFTRIEGVLADVAPTVLDLMGLSVPAEMTGINLLPRLLV
ncbi:MAG: 2,3-bisphosphoglycerate-independent phosphoglycerate mutase [Parcubacteria group bacterium GW2011_GWA2_47_10b]|nr:MAG: 2,3-bisphosphoglycerate-independent phosphoglycerate mutase [Parcubacteria group bacterium GW2011_GWA2_47_10b]